MSKLEQVDELLSKRSPTMCMAKWSQVTLHLQNGSTHSCHHPHTHTIPLVELETNPSALHNTLHKKQQRALMWEGKRPNECNYCWKMEDCGQYSDRHHKSADNIIGGDENWTRINAEGPYADYKPTYLEVSFSYNCNLKCMYCSPCVSSSWHKEIKQHGFYDFNGHRVHAELEIPGYPKPMQDEENPYLDAFWKWWPDVYKDLKVFRITGGEPLLSRDAMRALEWFIDNPSPDLEIAINSNLCVPDKVLDRLITTLDTLQKTKAVKEVKLFTSVENHGAKAEYIRTGLDYEQWKQNLCKLMDSNPYMKVTIMSTYNALSVRGFNDFLDDMAEIRKKYFCWEKRFFPITIDLPYLREPELMSIPVLTEDFLPDMENTLVHFKKTLDECYEGHEYDPFELQRMERLIEYFKSVLETHPISTKSFHQGMFYMYMTEKDKRHGTNFLETFPEYADFWEHCKNQTSSVKELKR